jgi:hypothetical protein
METQENIGMEILPQETAFGLIESVGDGDLVEDIAREFKRVMKAIYLPQDGGQASKGKLTITIEVKPSEEQIAGLEICNMTGEVKSNVSYSRKRQVNAVVMPDATVKHKNKRF